MDDINPTEIRYNWLHWILIIIKRYRGILVHKTVSLEVKEKTNKQDINIHFIARLEKQAFTEPRLANFLSQVNRCFFEDTLEKKKQNTFFVFRSTRKKTEIASKAPALVAMTCPEKMTIQGNVKKNTNIELYIFKISYVFTVTCCMYLSMFFI